jgi:hypothetical protein
MDFAGIWHIYKMEMWEESYFNMQVEAFVKLDSKRSGEFQFGLVSGSIYGSITDGLEGESLEFT